MSDSKGLYEKYVVIRTDRESLPGGKHDGCDYFILDLTHDPIARSAAWVYAHLCREKNPVLSRELQENVASLEPKPPEKGAGDV